MGRGQILLKTETECLDLSPDLFFFFSFFFKLFVHFTVNTNIHFRVTLIILALR